MTGRVTGSTMGCVTAFRETTLINYPLSTHLRHTTTPAIPVHPSTNTEMGTEQIRLASRPSRETALWLVSAPSVQIDRTICILGAGLGMGLRTTPAEKEHIQSKPAMKTITAITHTSRNRHPLADQSSRSKLSVL